MPSRKLKFLMLVFVSLLTVAVHAAEGEEGGKEAEGEGAKGAAPIPKEQKEFYDKTSKLNTLSSRIEEDEKEFQELVRAKAAEKNPEEKQRLIKRMVEVTNERNKSADAYMKIKSELTLRYPNQGEHLNRSYQTQTKKSVEELEGAAGLDELLTRTKKVVEKKYAAFEEKDADKKKAVAIKPKAEEDDGKPKKLRLEK